MCQVPFGAITIMARAEVLSSRPQAALAAAAPCTLALSTLQQRAARCVQIDELARLQAVCVWSLDVIVQHISEAAQDPTEMRRVVQALSLVSSRGAMYFHADQINSKVGFMKGVNSPRLLKQERVFARHWHAQTYQGDMRPDPAGCILKNACAHRCTCF